MRDAEGNEPCQWIPITAELVGGTGPFEPEIVLSTEAGDWLHLIVETETHTYWSHLPDLEVMGEGWDSYGWIVRNKKGTPDWEYAKQPD